MRPIDGINDLSPEEIKECRKALGNPALRKLMAAVRDQGVSGIPSGDVGQLQGQHAATAIGWAGAINQVYAVAFPTVHEEAESSPPPSEESYT